MPQSVSRAGQMRGKGHRRSHDPMFAGFKGFKQSWHVVRVVRPRDPGVALVPVVELAPSESSLYLYKSALIWPDFPSTPLLLLVLGLFLQLAFSKVKANLGLDQSLCCFTGAAPISPEVRKAADCSHSRRSLDWCLPVSSVDVFRQAFVPRT